MARSRTPRRARSWTRGRRRSPTTTRSVATTRPYLGDEIGALGLELLRAVKERCDPAGIMNPGKLRSSALRGTRRTRPATCSKGPRWRRLTARTSGRSDHPPVTTSRRRAGERLHAGEHVRARRADLLERGSILREVVAICVTVDDSLKLLARPDRALQDIAAFEGVAAHGEPSATARPHGRGVQWRRSRAGSPRRCRRSRARRPRRPRPRPPRPAAWSCPPTATRGSVPGAGRQAGEARSPPVAAPCGAAHGPAACGRVRRERRRVRPASGRRPRAARAGS